MGKPATRAPTARDGRMREAMAAILEHGSTRKAAAATEIPYRTIGTWAASEEGKTILAELQASPAGADRATKVFAAADDALEQLHDQIKGKAIKGKELAIVYGILVDKALRFAPKAEAFDPNGDMEIVVKFGGKRVEQTDEAEAAPGAIEGGAVASTSRVETSAGAEVSVRKRGKA